MPTATFTPVAHLHEVVPVEPFSSAGSYDPDDPLEVWLCEVGGGARIERIPASIVHDVKWGDARGQQASASFSIDRYAKVTEDADPDVESSWWVNRIHHDADEGMSEIQIVWNGQVRHWGPVVGKQETLAADRARITLADPQWYFGQRITDSAELIWSPNRVKNFRFDDEWSHWVKGAGLSFDTTTFESGSRSAQLDAGEWVRQTVQVGFTPGWRCLVRARVWVEDTAVGGTLKLDRTDLVQTIRKRATVTDDTPREQWTWLAIDTMVSNPGVLPALLTVEVEGPTSGGKILVDRVEMQAQPESLGIPDQPPKARLLTASLAASALIGMGGEGVNIGSVVSPSSTLVAAVWSQRNDMMVSESLRSVADRESGMEFRSLYTETARLVQAAEVVGVEHDPEDVTLRVRPGQGSVGQPNANAVGVDQAVTTPTTRMRVRSEEGFFDEAEDLSKWGGVLLERVKQAPMGVRVGDLGAHANAYLMAAEGSTEAVKLAVTDRTLINTLWRGDRVQVVVDDGPSKIDDLYRIESIQYEPKASPPIVADLVPWVDPGSLPKLPRPAVAKTGYTLEAEVVSQGRRVFDVERRLAAAPRNTDRLEDLLDTEVTYEGDDAVPDGYVLTWDDETQRWVGAEPSGGGSGAYASASAAGTWTGAAVTGDRVEWNLATSGYELTYIDSGSYPGIVRGFSVTEPGIYLVEASVKATMAGGSGELFVLIGMENSAGGQWQIGAGDTDDCRAAIIASDTGDDGAAVSALMPLGDGTSVYIDVDLGAGVTECEWRLQVSFIHEADVLTGACAS